MDEETRTNRALWDAWTPVHMRSGFYDVAAFRSGRSTLREIEMEALAAEVEGRSLLHLQCHFGLDTLSWARLGARVTGVDFSEQAIAAARQLAAETGLEAEFVVADVLRLDGVLDRTFDIVFTSYGVLPWLGDLRRWAEVAAALLRPGGVFYMVEFHPLLDMLDEDGRISHGYFDEGGPAYFEAEGSYAEPGAPVQGGSYQWAHGLGDVVTALCASGLRIEYVRELPYSPYGCYPYLEESGPGRWMARGWPAAPHVYSIRAHKPPPRGRS